MRDRSEHQRVNGAGHAAGELPEGCSDHLEQQRPKLVLQELKVGSGPRGIMARAELRAVLPASPSTVFKILTHAEASTAYRDVPQLCGWTLVEQLEPEHRVVEVTQVNKFDMLWCHRRMENRVRWEEDSRDPNRMVQTFSLLRGESWARFSGSWVVSAIPAPERASLTPARTPLSKTSSPGDGDSPVSVISSRNSGPLAVVANCDPQGAAAALGLEPSGWCSLELHQDFTPKGIPLPLRPFVGGPVRHAINNALKKLVEDIAVLAERVEAGASIEDAIAAERQYKVQAVAERLDKRAGRRNHGSGGASHHEKK